MKSVGIILREERTRKNISLNEVSIATKINIKFLQAMEDGDLEVLPQKTFLRGFVRSYAKYLGLNVEDTLKIFSEEMGSTKPALSLTPTESGSGASPNQPTQQSFNVSVSGSSSRIFAVVSVLGLMVFIVVLYKTVNKYEKEAIAPPTDSMASVDVGHEEAMPANALDQPTQTPTPSGQVLSITPSPVVSGAPSVIPLVPIGKLESVRVSELTENLIPLSPTRTSPTPAPASQNISPTAVPTPLTTPTEIPSPTVAQSPSVPQEIIIESLDQVSVEFRIDGAAPQTIALKPEQIHTFKAKKAISFVISNGGAVNVIHNGKDRGVPGTLGKPTNLKFP